MKGTHQIAPSIPKQNASIAELLEKRAEFLGFLRRRIADPAAAEDILQAIYARALGKSEQIQNAESVVAWFYRMLRNAIVDHYRRDDARSRAHQQFSADAATSYELETQANLCSCLAGVIGTLKPEYRAVLERIDLGGQSIAEYAEAQGTTPNNAFREVASSASRGGEEAHASLRRVRGPQMPGLHL